jgi:hypothetical protein
VTIRDTTGRTRWARVLTTALALSLALTLAAIAPVGASHPEDDDGKASRRGADGHSGAGAAAAESTGTQLVGHLDPGGGFHADVVVHQGTAYLGSWGAGAARCPSHGVRAISLADTSNPALLSTFADGASNPAVDGSWTEKVVVRSFEGRSFRGELAAVSFQRCRASGHRGFGLYDVTDPSNPQELALVPTAANGSHELWLERRGNRIFVYTAVINAELQTSPDFDPAEFVNGAVPAHWRPGTEADFQIWDVTDPRHPQKVSQWGAWAELGIAPRLRDANNVLRTSFVHSVIGAVVGNQHRAYLSYWDTGTVILDVSDPANPTFLGRTGFAAHEEGNAHSAWLARGGNLLIQTDEDFNPSGTAVIEAAWGYPRFFDVSDPSNPIQVSTFELPTTRQPDPDRPGDFTVHDPKVRGNMVYFSWYAEGVVVVDISDPGNPAQVAQFLPPPAEDPLGFFTPAQVNVWGVDIHRNYAVASDMSSGLWVFTVD